jgi:hypothetical protein
MRVPGRWALFSLSAAAFLLLGRHTRANLKARLCVRTYSLLFTFQDLRTHSDVKLALSKGHNAVVVFLLPDDGNRSSFRNAVL